MATSPSRLVAGADAALVGREAERQAIARMTGEARSGRSGVLALAGAPGTGKTALLLDTARRAYGMRVLRARGIQSEASIPFAGLLELLRPVLGHVSDIPGPQAAAIEGALALGPASPADRFAVGAATLSLLAAAAEQEPLLVLVDDIQWLDGASASALLFAWRRLVADPIGVLVGARAGLPSLLDGSDLPVLHLEGLELAAAAELLSSRSGRPLSPGSVERLHRHTGGNPLAMLELANDLDHYDFDAPIDTPPPMATSVSELYLNRVRRLPRQTQDLLLLAAVSDTQDLASITGAARRLGLDPRAIGPAEEQQLVLVGVTRLEFRHPLIRSAVYADADAARQRACHRALAEALPEAEADRRAWHLALGSLGPGEVACSALEQAGVRARERSAYHGASRAFERAAGLAPTEVWRARLLQAAAEAAWSAGLAARAAELVEVARRHDQTPESAVALEHLRGHVSARLGPVRQSQAILAAGAELARGVDDERAIVMLAEVVNAAFYAGDPVAMQAAAARIGELVPEGASARSTFYASVARGMALLFTGDEAGGAELLRRGATLALGSEELSDDSRLLVWAAMCPIWLRESGPIRSLIGRAVEVTRRRAAIGLLPYLLSHVAIDEATTDGWRAATATFHEVLGLSRETGQRTDLSAALSRLAWLEARMGREAECRAHAREALDLAAGLGLGLCEVWATAALGELELALGNSRAAVAAFERQEVVLRAHGIGDVDLSPGPELVELHARAGRRDRATTVARGYESRAVQKGQPWALARSARAQGLAAPETEMEEWFERALALHARTPDVYETARTQLAYGGRLRRSRKRIRAREQLRRAIASFDRLEAEPWSDMARAELAATGETARRRDPWAQEQLTPQELQIALALAGGRTTREAASALFLSPKTIEYHLRSVYRKFAIGSREELAAVMGTSPGA
ncbi:MAG: AAA family ATPase [Acidimicrobiales bacterium]